MTHYPSGLHDFMRARTVYDLRYCPLEYEDALQLTQVLWWLSRFRSVGADVDGVEHAYTSADGKGFVILLQPTGGERVVKRGTTWGYYTISEPWRGPYDGHVIVNMATYLVSSCLTKRLAELWSCYDVEDQFNRFHMASVSQGALDPEQNERLEILSRGLVHLYLLDQGRVSSDIARVAVRVAGDMGLRDLADRLEGMRNSLPRPPAVLAQRQAARQRIRDHRAKHGWARTPEAQSAYDRLDHQLRIVEARIDPLDDSRYELGRALDSTRRRFRCANDLDRLQELAARWQFIYARAISPDEDMEEIEARDSFWAMRQLRSLDRDRYLSVLERWLATARPRHASRILVAVAEADPDRALKLMNGMPEERRPRSQHAASVVLSATRATKDEGKALKRLLAFVRSHGLSSLQLRELISTIVPTGNALRFPGPAVDEVLLGYASPGFRDGAKNLYFEDVCGGLIRRGRPAYLAKVHRILSTEMKTGAGSGTWAYAHLVVATGDKYKDEFADAMRPRLAEARAPLLTWILRIWVADLTELKPDLERIATSGPDDVEDPAPEQRRKNGRAQAVRGRHHIAREILSIWNEEDLLTKAKLLVALGLHTPFWFVDPWYHGPSARMRKELTEIAARLSRSEVRALDSFLSLCETEARAKPSDYFRRASLKYVEQTRLVLERVLAE